MFLKTLERQNIFLGIKVAYKGHITSLSYSLDLIKETSLGCKLVETLLLLGQKAALTWNLTMLLPLDFSGQLKSSFILLLLDLYFFTLFAFLVNSYKNPSNTIGRRRYRSWMEKPVCIGRYNQFVSGGTTGLYRSKQGLVHGAEEEKRRKSGEEEEKKKEESSQLVCLYSLHCCSSVSAHHSTTTPVVLGSILYEPVLGSILYGPVRTDPTLDWNTDLDQYSKPCYRYCNKLKGRQEKACYIRKIGT